MSISPISTHQPPLLSICYQLITSDLTYIPSIALILFVIDAIELNVLVETILIVPWRVKTWVAEVL